MANRFPLVVDSSTQQIKELSENDNLDLTSNEIVGVTSITASGIVSAFSYYGDGSNLENIVSGIGIRTEGSIIGYGITFLDFRGAGISTVTVDSSSGIGTINIEGGGSGASISIGTAFVGIPTAGNLWYKSNDARLYIYYQDDDSAQWVDAAPFNVGIITTLSNVAFNSGSFNSPSIYFTSDPQTGWYSPSTGNQTFVSSGSSILNINSSGINVTGIITATSFVGDGSGLTGAGSTVADDTSTNETFYPIFTQTTSGTVTATKVSTTNLTFNPSTGSLSAVDFDSTSDINLKENIQIIENPIEKVLQLNGITFNWKSSHQSSAGVIAQEVEKVLPEIVRENDEHKSVSYNGLIGLLIEVVKEQQKQIDELKNRV